MRRHAMLGLAAAAVCLAACTAAKPAPPAVPVGWCRLEGSITNGEPLQDGERVSAALTALWLEADGTGLLLEGSWTWIYDAPVEDSGGFEEPGIVGLDGFTPKTTEIRWHGGDAVYSVQLAGDDQEWTCREIAHELDCQSASGVPGMHLSRTVNTDDARDCFGPTR